MEPRDREDNAEKLWRAYGPSDSLADRALVNLLLALSGNLVGMWVSFTLTMCAVWQSAKIISQGHVAWGVICLVATAVFIGSVFATNQFLKRGTYKKDEDDHANR